MEAATAADPRQGAAPAQNAGQEGKDVPERQRGPHPEAGKYVVLYAQPADEGVVTPWVVAGKYDASGQRDAKKQAIEADATVGQLANGPDGVHLVAVPAASWQPAHIVAEQPPPVMKGL
jgi:hypothetical protein